MPVVREALSPGVPVSVGHLQSRRSCRHAALELGADIINDIWALRQPGSQQVVAQHPRCGVPDAHMVGQPKRHAARRWKGDVAAAAALFCSSQARACCAGLRGRIAGTGLASSKSQQQICAAGQQAQLPSSGYPAAGGGRWRSALGAVTGLEVAERLAPRWLAVWRYGAAPIKS